MLNYGFITAILVTAVWGAVYEGLRTSQLCFMALFTIQAILIVSGVNSLIMLVFYFVGMAVIVGYVAGYGEGNLSRIKLVGPYQVGHREFHLQHSGNAVSVYYPMDKADYHKQRKNNTKWFRYGESSLKGMARATADIGSTKHPPSWFYNYLLKIKMNTV